MSALAPFERQEPVALRVLWESPGAAVQDFRCRAHVHPEGPEEPNPTHSIVFVRRGVFRRTWGRDRLVADANQVLFFNAGEAYRFAHPVAGGDDCTILAFATERVAELLARHSPAAAERPGAPFVLGHALSSRRAARLHYELMARVHEVPGGLEIDDVLAELADEAIACAFQAPTPRVVRALVAARHRDMVEATRVVLAGRLEAPPRLAELATALGCSPFHLSRTFREVAGMSLRRYVGRLRARSAAERLAHGARDLTALALDLGYADHAHFTNAFRREWGIPPSAFRARTSKRGRLARA